MTKQVKIFIIATLILSGMLVGGSYLVSKGIQLPLNKKPQPTPTPAANLIKTSPLFDSQTATIHGQVIQVIHNTLVTIQVKNQAGLTADFPIAPNLLIYKYQSAATATSSADLKTIELNKDALIDLEYIKGEYKVVSISYLASPSSSPTPKAK